MTPRETTTPRRGSAAIVVAIWTIPVVLSTFETVMFARMANRPMPLWRAFASEAPQWYVWALLTPLIIRLGARFSLERAPRGRAIAVHACACVAAGMLSALSSATAGVLLATRPISFTKTAFSWFISGLPVTALVYFSILGVAYAFRYAERLRERERHAEQLAAQLAESQLAALRMQLQPHFLFNSLNAITALVRDNESGGAVRALTLLGDVLRATLRAGTANAVTLADEVDFIRRYLEIEQVRFADRLRVEYDVPTTLLDALVPTFILQPFVENALRHGIMSARAGGRITISARAVNDDRLELLVTDDGRGLARAAEDPSTTSGGIGIANARARVSRMYPDGSVTVADSVSGKGVVARVEIPLERAPVAELRERPMPARVTA